ncbi:MAG: sensor domain-containing diguanylate cyclase [Acidobacteriota bacterium]
MRDRTLQKFIRSIAWFLCALTWAFAVRQVWNLAPLQSTDWPPRLVLAGTAWACFRVSRRGVASFASSSLIALLVLWSDPWSLALGLIVLAAGRGRRPQRDRRHPIHAVSACSVAWSLSYALLASEIFPAIEPTWLGLTLRIGIAWSVFEAVSWALVQPLESGRRAAIPPFGRTEWLNPVIGALLVALQTAAGSIAALAAPLTLVGQVLLVRLDQARRELRRTKRALESRTAELLTVRAIGQELLARPGRRQLGPLLDRECRKLFDPEGFTLLLADDGVLRAVYRRRGERKSTQRVTADPSLVHWLQEEKRGLCWRKEEQKLTLRTLIPQARSALIAPFLIDQHVAGALIVESREPDRYDEHQLAVLSTVAQQAAAALESAQRQRRATIDSLTGFFLREYFFRRLEQEQRRARRYGGRFALLMLDLDAFKPINDRHGHLAGDRYLRAVATTIRAQLRSADMPCRYGGDEFSLLLPETDLQGASVIAERIREAVSQLEIEAEGTLLRSTISIGLATFPEHSTDEANGLMRHADEALYRAKRGGRDRVVHYAS